MQGGVPAGADQTWKELTRWLAAKPNDAVLLLFENVEAVLPDADEVMAVGGTYDQISLWTKSDDR